MSSENDRGIKIVAIQGSLRPDNFTAKALAVAADEIRRHADVSLECIDPGELDLLPPGEGSETRALKTFRETVAGATGVLFATPEYHGSYSSVIKLVIENLGFPSVLAGKPIALLGVAAGQIGAIKALEHLRSVCSHIGAIVLPGPVSVAGVRQVFDERGRCLDERVEQRIRGGATALIDYIRGNVCPRIALEQMVREGSTSE